MTVAARMLVRVELAALLMMMVRGNPVSCSVGKLGAVRPQNQKGQAQHTSRECRETPHEVLACALENHPDIRERQAALAQAMSLSSQASQRVNPELTSQGVRGGSGETRFTYLELNFAHTFELAGKRPARLARSQASAARATAELEGVRKIKLEIRKPGLAAPAAHPLRGELGIDALGGLARQRHRLSERSLALADVWMIFQSAREHIARLRNLRTIGRGAGMSDGQ